MTGRPAKLTAERAEKILAAARAGVSRDAQAAAGGVDRSTLKRWLAKGREQKSGRYRAFRAALSRAENEAELRLVLRLQQIIGQSKDIRTAAASVRWLLERKFPLRFGRQDTHTLKGDANAPVQVTFVPEVGGPPAAPPEAVRARLAQRGTPNSQ